MLQEGIFQFLQQSSIRLDDIPGSPGRFFYQITNLLINLLGGFI